MAGEVVQRWAGGRGGVRRHGASRKGQQGRLGLRWGLVGDAWGSKGGASRRRGEPGGGKPAAARTDGKDGGALFPVGRGGGTMGGLICNFPKFHGPN